MTKITTGKTRMTDPLLNFASIITQKDIGPQNAEHKKH